MVSLIAGCGVLPAPYVPQPTLPTVAAEPPGETPAAWAGVGLAAVLQGAAWDPSLAWLEHLDGGGRQEVIWPAGYSARFVPQLEILDATGRVVMRQDDFVDGGCSTGLPGVLLLIPPYLGLRLECGPIEVDRCTAAAYEIASEHGGRGRDITEVRLLGRDGSYQVVFDDGSKLGGRAPVP